MLTICLHYIILLNKCVGQRINIHFLYIIHGLKFTFNVNIVYLGPTETVPLYFEIIFEREKYYVASIILIEYNYCNIVSGIGYRVQKSSKIHL